MKIYNVKMVKTEMARGPAKLCRNQNPFGSLQIDPQADAWWVGLNLFVKKMFLVHPTAQRSQSHTCPDRQKVSICMHSSFRWKS